MRTPKRFSISEMSCAVGQSDVTCTLFTLIFLPKLACTRCSAVWLR